MTSAANRVAARFASPKTASLWNSSWSKVTAYVDGWHIRIQVKTSRSPTGLVDEASERVCRDMKAEAKKDIDALMGSLKPKRLEFEKYVFLSGGDGGAVDYTYGVDVYAKDDKHAKAISDALGLHGVSIK